MAMSVHRGDRRMQQGLGQSLRTVCLQTFLERTDRLHQQRAFFRGGAGRGGRVAGRIGVPVDPTPRRVARAARPGKPLLLGGGAPARGAGGRPGGCAGDGAVAVAMAVALDAAGDVAVAVAAPVVAAAAAARVSAAVAPVAPVAVLVVGAAVADGGGLAAVGCTGGGGVLAAGAWGQEPQVRQHCEARPVRHASGLDVRIVPRWHEPGDDLAEHGEEDEGGPRDGGGQREIAHCS
mmetsp:Transcript_243/g.1023  ORF Transcript_243/g.1023 Transcript_243/m.1023 type:complete len:235 (-) Transcript_243:326-1030(-)